MEWAPRQAFQGEEIAVFYTPACSLVYDSRILEQSRELNANAQEDRGHSSEEEGWGENDVAPGQQLSDYRPLNEPLASIETASKISESGW